ncbi:Os04g0584201 [Oryza sativa Japonica Group]|uniref:Os04g0584201 protein n=2 Tax=Oryza sativa subsp. japonica TaxID=39947 RepID=C7J123_ORYSJ|nr:hypothetical protein EE612_025186 [Oryza sativa]BAH92796.1 Os04g0584100 [Oryza sativa Japonica Group]BAS90679.1 Os04g0584201 [Oryza sativa Japonica Group]|eukprot:NP_001174068.1 Os04g0584100 [Oryza sativa Japonica Group]
MLLLAVVVRHGAARAPPGEHLHDEHPERVHVRVEAGASGEEALVRHVAAGARHGLRRVVRHLVEVDDTGEAEVAEARAVLLVEHDVARLDVPVEDPAAAPVVQVLQRGRHAADYLVPSLPGQLSRSSTAIQELVQATHGEVLVDEEQLASLVAPPDQLHEVAVRELADRVHLRDELLLSSVGTGFVVRCHPLDGHLHVHAAQVAVVHGAEATSAELARGAEVGSRTPELLELKFDRAMGVDHLLEVAVGEPSLPRRPSPHQEHKKRRHSK